MTSRLMDRHLWMTVLVLLASVCLSIVTYLRWFQLGFFLGPFRFSHWLAWIGVLFVAVYTPLYYVLKRRYAERVKTFLGIHVIGNLLSFTFVSIHFASQVSRPPQSFPDLGTGIVLYIVMIVMVVTGIFQRFQIAKKFGKKWRFLHTSVAISFYLVIFVHVLHGLGIL